MRLCRLLDCMIFLLGRKATTKVIVGPFSCLKLKTGRTGTEDEEGTGTTLAGEFYLKGQTFLISFFADALNRINRDIFHVAEVSQQPISGASFIKLDEEVPKEKVEEEPNAASVDGPALPSNPLSFRELCDESRHYNIDLAPKLSLCDGPLVKLLVSSGVHRYTEFKVF